jgi:hypothetical protein
MFVVKRHLHVLHAGDDSAHVRGMLPFHKAADCAIDRVAIHASKSNVHARVARNVSCTAINISLAMMFTVNYRSAPLSLGSSHVTLPVDAQRPASCGMPEID